MCFTAEEMWGTREQKELWDFLLQIWLAGCLDGPQLQWEPTLNKKYQNMKEEVKMVLVHNLDFLVAGVASANGNQCFRH